MRIIGLMWVIGLMSIIGLMRVIGLMCIIGLMRISGQVLSGWLFFFWSHFFIIKEKYQSIALPHQLYTIRFVINSKRYLNLTHCSIITNRLSIPPKPKPTPAPKQNAQKQKLQVTV
jgi:hypothetical protein